MFSFLQIFEFSSVGDLVALSSSLFILLKGSNNRLDYLSSKTLLTYTRNLNLTIIFEFWLLGVTETDES